MGFVHFWVISWFWHGMVHRLFEHLVTRPGYVIEKAIESGDRNS